MDNQDLNDFSIVKLSKAKDGDIILFKSDCVDENVIARFRDSIKKMLPNVKLGIVAMDPGDDLTLLNGDEARTLLKQIAEADRGQS